MGGAVGFRSKRRINKIENFSQNPLAYDLMFWLNNYLMLTSKSTEFPLGEKKEKKKEKKKKEKEKIKGGKKQQKITPTRNPTGDLPIGKRKFDQPNNNKIIFRFTIAYG